MPDSFGTIRALTQLELENFGKAFTAVDDESDGGIALSYADIQKREMAAKLALREKMHGDDLPSWAEKYHRLIEAGWKWKMAAYAAWSSMPKSLRVPQTQSELAEILGLGSDRVFSTWNKKYPTLQQVIADLAADDLMDARADVFYTLKQMASTPDYKNHNDRKVYLEMIGAYVPTSKLAAELKRRGITTDDLVDMSDEELRVLAGEAIKSLSNKTASQSDEELGAEQ